MTTRSMGRFTTEEWMDEHLSKADQRAILDRRCAMTPLQKMALELRAAEVKQEERRAAAEAKRQRAAEAERQRVIREQRAEIRREIAEDLRKYGK
jgi:hypothetical protein